MVVVITFYIMKKLLGILLVLGLFSMDNVNAACDDTLTDGVDYSNCQFSDEQIVELLSVGLIVLTVEELID